MARRLSKCAQYSVAVVVGCLWAHQFGSIVMVVGLLILLLHRSRVLSLLTLLIVSSSWAATAIEKTTIEPTGNKSGCFTVLQWPHINNFGSTETILRVSSYRVHVTDDKLGRFQPMMFDKMCAEGSLGPLSSFSRQYLRSQHVVAELKLSEIQSVHRASFPESVMGSVHRVWYKGLDTMSPRNASLFKGIVLGDTSDQSQQDKALFRDSGLLHIMAVSGENVAFVLIIAFGFGGLPRSISRTLPVLGVLGAFALMTGLQPSVLRAVVMAVVATMSQTFGLKLQRDTPLHIALISLLAIDPLLIKQLGFQLSVGATAGIVYLSPFFERHCPTNRIGRSIGIALGAQVGTIVPMAIGLHRITPFSALLFIVIEPVVGALMIIGVSFGLLAGLIPQLTYSYGWLCSLGSEIVLRSAQFGASFPNAVQYCGWIVPFGLLLRRSSKKSVPQTRLAT